MKPINTIADLREEKKRLQKKQVELEYLIKEDFMGFREEFDQKNIFRNAVHKLWDKDDGLIGYTGDAVTGFMVNKLLLRRADFLTRFLVSLAARGVTHTFLARKRPIFNKWITLAFQKISNRKNKPYRRTVTP